VKNRFFAKIVRERAIGLYMPLFTLEEVEVFNSIIQREGRRLGAAEVIARYNLVRNTIYELGAG
jgi:hypothetical protein